MLRPDQVQRAFNRPLPEPTVDVPDDVLVNTMAGYGFDRSESFVQFKHTMPQQYNWLRSIALKFYADVVAANRGDADAKERVDYCAEVWRGMLRRRIENGHRGDAFTPEERRILRRMGLSYS